jgi:putative acetyltransferase
MLMEIREDDLKGKAIADLLAAHLEEMRTLSPVDSVHTLDLAALREPDIAFWTVWEGEQLLGCGALKELDPHHGEIKSMHTLKRFRGKSVARLIVKHIVKTARDRRYQRLSLETGSMEPFEPAHNLYRSFGFVECKPFENYKEDPHSLFMTLKLVQIRNL